MIIIQVRGLGSAFFRIFEKTIDFFLNMLYNIGDKTGDDTYER